MEHPLKQRPEIYKDYEDLVKSFIVYSITKSESDKESLTELCKTILYNKLNSNQEEQDFYSLFFIDGSGYINMPLDIANMVPDVSPEQMLSKIDLLTIRLREELEKEHGTLNRDIGYLTGVDEVNVNNVKEVNEKLAAKLTSPVDTNVSNQGDQPKTQGDSKMKIEDINNFISNKIEENLNLDYKASDALQRNDKKTNEISKDVSAFANSDVGLIIYGIKEDEDIQF